MMTIGKKIVPLDPFSAFIVTFANAITVHLFTQVGVPVSSSQAIVGTIIGIGILKGAKTISKRIVISIGISWFTVPILSGLLSCSFILMSGWLF